MCNKKSIFYVIKVVENRLPNGYFAKKWQISEKLDTDEGNKIWAVEARVSKD